MSSEIDVDDDELLALAEQVAARRGEALPDVVVKLLREYVRTDPDRAGQP